MSDVLRDLASLVGSDPELTNRLRLRQGVCTVHFYYDSISVKLAGSDTTIDSVRFLQSCYPRVGDTVWLLQNGPDLLCIGAIKLGADWIDWTTAGGTFGSGVAHIGSPWQTPQIKRTADGMVHTRGVLKATTGLASNGIGLVVPAGYRPPAQDILTHWSDTGGVQQFMRYDLYANGEMHVQLAIAAGANFGLGGLCWGTDPV